MFKQGIKKLPGLVWFLWVPVLVLLDQATKWFALHHVAEQGTVSVMPGLKLILAHNTGIAFSLLKNQNSFGRAVLLLGIIIICFVIATWLAKTSPREKWSGIALTLILGGALGNLWDRIYYGHVIDFIDFYIQSWHWYTFNLADSFITVGAIMLFKMILIPDKQR